MLNNMYLWEVIFLFCFSLVVFTVTIFYLARPQK